MQTEIKHPVLGSLVWNKNLNSWESEIQFRSGHPIPICLTTLMGTEPTSNIEDLLQSGCHMLDWARLNEQESRERISDELLALYNHTWAPEDTPAPMSRTEFAKRIEPNSLVLDVNGNGYFYWGDDGLFAGHWIEVRFSKDLKITEVGLAG